MSVKPWKTHDVEVADLRPGRLFESRFSDDEGFEHVEVFEVTGWPFYVEGSVAGWKVPTRDPESGFEHSWYLSDLGIEPYRGGRWNSRRLVILEVVL